MIEQWDNTRNFNSTKIRVINNVLQRKTDTR